MLALLTVLVWYKSVSQQKRLAQTVTMMPSGIS